MPDSLMTYSECSADEALNYFHAYMAATDLTGAAQAKFDTLANSATSPVDQSSYRADSLECARDLELLKNQYRAFLNDQSPVSPPDDATVQKIRDATTALASIVASDATADSILTALNDGMNIFADLHTPQ